MSISSDSGIEGSLKNRNKRGKHWSMWEKKTDDGNSPGVALTRYSSTKEKHHYEEIGNYFKPSPGDTTLSTQSSMTSQDEGVRTMLIDGQIRKRKVEFPPLGDGLENGVATENANFSKVAARKKSQWDEYVDTLDVNKSIQSGTFKVTLHQLARDGEAVTLYEMLKSVPEQQRRRILNTSTDEEGVTAIHLASRHNHYDVCKLLIDYGANVDSRGEGKATPLHYAARYKPKKRTDQCESPYVNSTQGRNVIDLLASHGAHVNNADSEGQTPLHCASIKGNAEAVKKLLECRGIAIECIDSQGMTALHMAATHGHVDIVKMLINERADLHSCDNDLMTPLHFACSEGNIEIVRMILLQGQKEGTIAMVKKMLLRTDAGKNTSLHLSVGKGHKEMVLELLAWSGKASDAMQFVNVTRAHGDTALHIAAAQGHIEIVKILMDSGAKVNARNDSLATALLLAAQHNYFNVVEHLLESKAEMEIRDKDNLTPLLVASKNGHLETISWLIENGADVTANDKNDKSCLMLAVEEKRTYAVQELLKFDSVLKLLDETDKNANSVLHMAAKKGYLPIITILVENGARIDFKNEDEATPVHIAAMHGQHIALRELLDHDKTMINSLDENANTALHLAAAKGHTKSVQVLLEHGVNVGLRNTRQWTALDCACTRGWEATVVELLHAQSPINPPNGSRTTPLHQACTNGHAHVVKVLLEWRADVSARIADGRNPLDCAIDKDNRECVQTLLQHDSWKLAMRNAYMDNMSDHVTTPVRKLILKMPDMAELAFSRCITNNQKPPDDPELEVTLDYEFLDDMYTILEWGQPNYQHHEDDDVIPDVSTKKVIISEMGYEAFNDHGRLAKNAMTYVEESSVLRHNHPLSIMVNRKRERLLQHPVVTGLLQYKWNKYGGLVYYSSLVFLLLFVALLNSYLLLIPPPYAIDFLRSLANRRFYQEFSAEHITNYTAPDACYSLLQSGAEYRGHERVSQSGHACIPWADTSTNSQLFPDAGLNDNYCRNPGTQLKQPWCYTNYSDSDASKREREVCNIKACTIFVKGSNVPLGATCKFPFKYGGANFTECLVHSTEGLWCAYTYDYDKDKKWGTCSEEDSLCNVDKEHQKPCGSPGTDKLNCEARDCCFVTHDQGQPTEWSECFQKLDPCSDRSSYCPVYKKNGLCIAQRTAMEVRCAKTCGFCNVTDSSAINDEYHKFLYLMSIYPELTFDPNWTPGCYFALADAEGKWGGSCHHKEAWQDPIRLTLLVFCFFNILLLLLQIWNYQWEAFQPIFFLEGILFILCLFLTFDFNHFDLQYSRQMTSEKALYLPLVSEFQRETGLRQNWQWQCGVMALFLSWMDLLLYIRKIPYLGIYVVMFNDVFKTFVKFSLVFLLFILSFAFTFHTLLQNEAQFEQPFNAILKTTVMMVGEIDFGGTFFGDRSKYNHQVNYELVTYLIFSIFIIVMMIIIMNLLVGLAVGDIIEVKEHATLERLKMQVELALEVEFSVPDFLRKQFVRKSETIRPNRYRKSNALIKAFFQNQDLSSKNIVNAMNPNKTETEEIHENVTLLNHVIRGVRNKTNDVDSMMRDVMSEIRELKVVMETMSMTSGVVRPREQEKRQSKKRETLRRTQEDDDTETTPTPDQTNQNEDGDSRDPIHVIQSPMQMPATVMSYPERNGGYINYEYVDSEI